MSPANVERYRQALDAVNRRDLGGVLALMDSEVQAISLLVAIDGGYQGHDGIRRWWKNVFDAFPDYTLEAVDVRDLGHLTLASLRTRGHGALSEAPLDVRRWHLAEWRTGKIVWWASYRSEADALEAAEARGPGGS